MVTEIQLVGGVEAELLGGGCVDEHELFVMMTGGDMDFRLPLSKCQRHEGAGTQVQLLEQLGIDAQDAVHQRLGVGFRLYGHDGTRLGSFHADSSRSPGRVSIYQRLTYCMKEWQAGCMR
ncbi:MAG: hypothetical protein A6D91_10990 [Bacillaceae bacterium G1]|nr:MAG: hypothetical protein A6D91_10990 [Bacillaceae bacterium G1]